MAQNVQQRDRAVRVHWVYAKAGDPTADFKYDPQLTGGYEWYVVEKRPHNDDSGVGNPGKVKVRKANSQQTWEIGHEKIYDHKWEQPRNR